MNRFGARTRWDALLLAGRRVGFPSLTLGATVVVAALAAGCGSAISSAAPSGGGNTDTTTGGTTGGGGAGGSGAGGAAPADGVPCDVATVLSKYCLSCHGHPVSGNAPVSLVTYAELTAPSANDPTKTEIERSVIRMQQAQAPMPPAGGVAAADIAVLQAWITAGTPKGSCGGAGAGGAAPNPFNEPAKCTSGQTWNGYAGNDMSPGGACNQCHNQGEGPNLDIAGTVYPSAHEPNDCIASGVSGAVVEITGADKAVFTLTVSPNSGNFRSHNSQNIVKPYTAKVKFEGRERVMATPQSNGDCNLCHTQNGAQNAPGRILLP